MKNSNTPICGAKNRNGKPCERPPLKGKTRCRLHGGLSKSGAESGPYSHGIYAEAYSEDEIAMLDYLNSRLGAVDDEINMTRIRLRRAQLAEKKALEAEEAELEVDEIRDVTGGPMKGTTTVRKKTDFNAIIDRLTGRLGSLMKTRAELISAETAKDADVVAEQARRIKAAIGAIEGAVVGVDEAS